MFNLLQVDFCNGEEICFSVRFKCSTEKKYFPANQFPVIAGALGSNLY